jgi:NAD(P)-dependent dehydrogenase (short-subunit alcohol dehydrogenase family)
MSTKSEKVALVTGASRGIGRAIALALGEEKFSVIVNYAGNKPAADEVCAMIETSGAKSRAIQADISKAEDRKKLVDETMSTFGRIDVLVNNAGVAPSKRADILSVADATEESFDRLININLKGPYFLTQLVANEMVKEATKRPSDEATEGAIASSPSSLRRSVASSRSKIINNTTVRCYTASVNRGDYCIAKAGLSMMTRLWAARLAEFGINVYEIRPGIIETDMTGPVKAKYDELIYEKDLTPIKRWGKPEDVARAVIAIAKDLLPFSTGEVIDVDGGFHLRRL